MQILRDHLLAFARHYLVALQYFTRLPVTGPLANWAGFQPERLRASAPHFPGVGLLVGGVACFAFALVGVGLPEGPASAMAAALLSTAATALLTGAFHEDGLADTADGLGGSADRERALEIMKDSRIGSFGALALLLVLGAKVALLGVLAAHSAAGVITALLAAHAVSRFWPLVLVHTMEHVGDPAMSKSKSLAGHIDRRGLAVAGLWCLLPLLLMVLSDGWPFLVLALAFSAGALFGLRAWLRQRLQGFTGDTLGAAQQVCEVAFYLGAAFGLGR